jgi:hypothetical protein
VIGTPPQDSYKELKIEYELKQSKLFLKQIKFNQLDK